MVGAALVGSRVSHPDQVAPCRFRFPCASQEYQSGAQPVLSEEEQQLRVSSRVHLDCAKQGRR